MTMVISSSVATIAHSTVPSCWSGSQPETASIQSGQMSVMRHRLPLITATIVSTQNWRRSFRFALLSMGYLLAGILRAIRGFANQHGLDCILGVVGGCLQGHT